MKKTLIIVEGDADVVFIKQYIKHIFELYIYQNTEIISAGGWSNITSKNEGELIRNQLIKNLQDDGTNIIIFDADKDFNSRQKEIKIWETKYGLTFALFLFPNNSNPGALEDLLENIINPANQPIFDCWACYEDCLKTKTVPCKPTLTIPAKKTKIYGYLESLLGESYSQKEKIKERNREYNNTNFWNLNAIYLNNLKSFLQENIEL